MTQIARPIADVFDGHWTPVPIYPQINGGTAGPGAVTSSANPQGDSFEVQLTPLAWPDPGAETLTVSLRKIGTDPLSVTIALLQGNTVIASKQVNPSTGFTNYTLTLTDAQVAAITDYTQLRALVTAGSPVVPCCPDGVPPILHLTLSNGTGDCGCLDGEYALTWLEGGSTWANQTLTLCGHLIYLSATCNNDGTWTITGSEGIAFFSGTTGMFTCTPLAITINSMPVSFICSGTIDATITV